MKTISNLLSTILLLLSTIILLEVHCMTNEFIFIFECLRQSINQSISVYSAFKQTNDNNIHTFVNINTERAGNEVMLLI